MIDQNMAVVLLLVVIFVMASYTARSKRYKLLAHYTSQNKTEADLWVKEKNGKVVIDNKQFTVLPDGITSYWFDKGFNWLFPTKVQYIKFSWYSRWPHNPNNYKVHLDSPALAKAVDTGDMMQSYGRTASPTSTGKKQSMLMAYLPLISIILVALVGYYLFTQQEAMGQHLMQLQNSINALTK